MPTVSAVSATVPTALKFDARRVPLGIRTGNGTVQLLDGSIRVAAVPKSSRVTGNEANVASAVAAPVARRNLPSIGVADKSQMCIPYDQTSAEPTLATRMPQVVPANELVVVLVVQVIESSVGNVS